MKTLFLFTAASLLAANPPVRVLRVPNGGIQPHAIADAHGTLHLLYFLGKPAAGDLFYVTSQDGGRFWSVPLRVNSTPGSAISAGTIRGGEMALGRNGEVFVAWNGSSQARPRGPINPESGKPGDPMLFTRLNNARSAFEPERNLMTRTFGLDGGGALAADHNGHVYVTWHGKSSGAAAGEAGRQVWITLSNDDGATFGAEEPVHLTNVSEPLGACACCGMAISVAPDGSLRILYRSATHELNRDVYLLTSSTRRDSYTARKLSSWQLNACPMTSMSFAQESSREEAAWESRGNVFFTDLTDLMAHPIAAPGVGTNRKHPRLAIDEHGETMMTWTEDTSWGRGGSIAWQIYDPRGRPQSDIEHRSGLPAWSFAAVAALRGKFLVFY